jgi:serine/threonine protein kinase
MDFVQGTSLAELTAKSVTLELTRTLKLMSQVADALQRAHANGVIHRDLKPSNIMLVQVDGTECAKILDFGIAKIMEPEEMGIKMTQTGEVFGSPAYMSPEQSLGKKVDERTDQYALGCVMFECLTGGPPFMGDNAVDTLMRQIHYSPPSLKEASLGKEFSKEVEELVARLLRKDPSQRFSSMTEVRQRLHEIINPLSTFSKVVRDAQRADWKQVRGGTLMGVAIGLGMGLLIAYVSWLYRPPSAADLHQNRSNSEISENVRKVQDGHSADTELAQLAETSPNLQSLDLTDRPITDAGLRYLPRFANLKGLKLDKCNNITDDGLESLKPLGRLKNLSLLAVGNITNRGVSYLTQLPIERLQLGQTGVSDSVVELLAQMRSLRTVDLSDCNLTDGAVFRLGHSRLHLEDLRLGNEIEVTDSGFAALGNMKSLRSLHLDENLTLGPCLAGFADLDLYAISLNRTAVRDSDLKVLLRMKNLFAVDLSRTGITDDGLATLAKVKTLKFIRLEDVYSVSDAGLKKLKAALPGAKISASQIRNRLVRNSRQITPLVLKYGMEPINDDLRLSPSK